MSLALRNIKSHKDSENCHPTLNILCLNFKFHFPIEQQVLRDLATRKTRSESEYWLWLINMFLLYVVAFFFYIYK